jgi:hypothetical protein
MQNQQFEAAKTTLAAAREAATNTVSNDRVAAFEELATCAEQFYGYRAQALAEVQPGAEFDIPTASSSRKIGIIEINEKEFVYREKGRTKRVPSNQIPSAVLTHIVREWFDSRPENHLFLAAYYATRPEPDLTKAREEWDRAKAGGVNTEHLKRLLHDPALTGSQ